MSIDLAAQVEQERAELAAAPRVEPGPAIVRCHWCGQVSDTATLVEMVDGQERYKGGCCGG
jgi:hypothetical protein